MTLSLTTRSQHTGQSWVRSRTSFQGSSHPTLDKCRLKVCNPGILLTPMYKQFSSGTHFWKHNHHNPLVFSSQKCDVFILLSDFTFLFGMVDAYLSRRIPPFYHPTLPPPWSAPHAWSVPSLQHRHPFPSKCSGFLPEPPGYWSIPPKRQEKLSTQKNKNGCEWYRFWSFLLGGIWVFESH